MSFGCGSWHQDTLVDLSQTFHVSHVCLPLVGPCIPYIWGVNVAIFHGASSSYLGAQARSLDIWWTGRAPLTYPPSHPWWDECMCHELWLDCFALPGAKAETSPAYLESLVGHRSLKWSSGPYLGLPTVQHVKPLLHRRLSKAITYTPTNTSHGSGVHPLFVQENRLPFWTTPSTSMVFVRVYLWGGPPTGSLVCEARSIRIFCSTELLDLMFVFTSGGLRTSNPSVFVGTK